MWSRIVVVDMPESMEYGSPKSNFDNPSKRRQACNIFKATEHIIYRAIGSLI